MFRRFVILIVASLAVGFAADNVKVVEEIAAKVNGDIITRGELAKKRLDIEAEAKRQGLSGARLQQAVDEVVAFYRIHIRCVHAGFFQTIAQLRSKGVPPNISDHRNGVPEFRCCDSLICALSAIKSAKAIANDRFPNLRNPISPHY